MIWRMRRDNLLLRCSDQSKGSVRYFVHLAETIIASEVRHTVSALLQEILEGDVNASMMS